MGTEVGDLQDQVLEQGFAVELGREGVAISYGATWDSRAFGDKL